MGRLVYWFIHALRALGILFAVGGVYGIFNPDEVSRLAAVGMFVAGSVVGAWAHGIITRARF